MNHQASPGDMGADRAERLRRRLESRFAPSVLVIEDESPLHAGHAGAAGGHGHFRIRIVAEAFRGESAVARHRLLTYGIGAALTLDEFAIWLNLDPNAYWSELNRESIDAILLFGALLAIGTWGAPLFQRMEAKFQLPK